MAVVRARLVLAQVLLVLAVLAVVAIVARAVVRPVARVVRRAVDVVACVDVGAGRVVDARML